MFIKVLISTLFLLYFSGCGSIKQITIPSYTAPKEVAKLSKIETKDEFISDGAYLALWINPKVLGLEKKNQKLKSYLIDNVKVKLTETNFIAIDPMGAENGVVLSMNVSNYKYTLLKKSSMNKATLALEVTFILSRGMEEFLVKKYNAKKFRQSRDLSRLPSENELAADAAAKVVRYFIMDISPTTTYQLRQFKPFEKEIERVFKYAQKREYKGAIKLMNAYSKKRDMNYYYNLAILYEAEASVSKNLKMLRLAKLNYNKAIELGGSSDTTIVNAQIRFDKFYDLLNQTKRQAKANRALIEDRNSMGGSSDNEYE